MIHLFVTIIKNIYHDMIHLLVVAVKNIYHDMIHLFVVAVKNIYHDLSFFKHIEDETFHLFSALVKKKI